jgi:signal transduction histidine kinase
MPGCGIGAGARGEDHVPMPSVTTDAPTTELPEAGARDSSRDGPVPARRRRSLGAFLVQLLRDGAYLLVSLPLGVLLFSVAVAGWSTALSTLLTFIGVPVAVLTIAALRGLARVERHRAAFVLREPVPEHYLVPLPLRKDDWRSIGAIWEWFKGLFQDRQMWRDLLYALLLLPVGVIGFTVLVIAVTITVGFISFPAWWWALPDGWDSGAWTIDTWNEAWIIMAAGIVLLPIAALMVRGTAAASAGLACGLLAPTRKELERRVERLRETRAGAVDAARLELERIERDLHDGAQARLVAVAMGLGRAEQKLGAGDTGAAAELVSEAREETQRALAELRDLARGIRPALLSERGLREAVTSLAARAGVPTTVICDIGASVPAPVETAAYFVVGEALANVGKHAGAQSAAVRVERRGARLEVEVRDDGHGGANPAGSGLTGLRKRVEALDGTLLISSPAGGPTILRAELPCVS